MPHADRRVPHADGVGRHADRVVLVTGGSGGIGAAFVARYLAEGAAVGIVDFNAEAGAKQAAQWRAQGGRVHFAAADVADYAQCERAQHEIETALGPIDILINNAGVSVPADLTSAGWEDSWAFTFEVNLTAQARLVRACHEDLVRAELAAEGGGRIVNIASTEGLGATKGMSPYTASKTGVIGLTRSLALEYGETGVTVNCICPGPIRTGMTAEIPDRHKEKFARRRVPKRRYGDPEEVAQITVSLVLPAASYLNGAIIPVDGGMIAQNT